jgi:hypothetical protein
MKEEKQLERTKSDAALLLPTSSCSMKKSMQRTQVECRKKYFFSKHYLEQSLLAVESNG